MRYSVRSRGVLPCVPVLATCWWVYGLPLLHCRAYQELIFVVQPLPYQGEYEPPSH